MLGGLLASLALFLQGHRVGVTISRPGTREQLAGARRIAPRRLTSPGSNSRRWPGPADTLSPYGIEISTCPSMTRFAPARAPRALAAPHGWEMQQDRPSIVRRGEDLRFVRFDPDRPQVPTLHLPPPSSCLSPRKGLSRPSRRSRLEPRAASIRCSFYSIFSTASRPSSSCGLPPSRSASGQKKMYSPDFRSIGVVCDLPPSRTAVLCAASKSM